MNVLRKTVNNKMLSHCIESNNLLEFWEYTHKDLVTHYYTKDPESHPVNNELKDYPSQDYVYLDVETNAETPQSPIFCFAFCQSLSKVYIMVDEQETNILKDMSRDDIKQTVLNEFSKDFNANTFEVDYYPINSEKFIESILDDIQEFNKEYKDKKIGLAGHNVFFDLGMLCNQDDKKFTSGQIADTEWDSAKSAGKYTIKSKNAGAYGRMYNLTHKNKTVYDFNVCDTMTVAESLYKDKALSDLCEYYNIDSIEVEQEEHGILNKKYIKYNVNDVVSTKKVYDKLKKEVTKKYKVNKPLHYIFSSASIAKQKMRQMDYNRVEYTYKAKSICSKSYFGGQTEALKVAQLIKNVDYTDILSQYPTASSLTECWDYMQAESISIKDISKDELPQVELKDLEEKETWKDISKYYVVVDAENDTLPIRSDLTNKDTTRVYKANVETEENLIYHYMDIVGSKILQDGNNIEIKKAFKIQKEGQQELKPCKIGSTKIPAYSNLMAKTIEERKRIQHKENGGDKDENTLAMKVIANSLYGVTAERISEQKKDKDGNITKRFDKAGSYYNPHCASTITAAGRLMLSMGEAIAKENNGEMYYCDTDSLILDSHVSGEVIKSFNKINPYSGVAGNLDVLEIEKEDGRELSNVDLFAIDVKKYAILKDNRIIMNKEHGLGHYKNMRDDETVTKFWTSLIELLTNRNINNECLSDEEEDKIIKWENSCSTWTVRTQLSNRLEMDLNYGDFIERTISNEDGEEIIYISLDLDNQDAIKINIDAGNITMVDSVDKTHCKNVYEVLLQWQMRAIQNSDGRETVTVNNTELVNKEARSLKDAFRQKQKEAYQQVDLSTLL